MGSYLKNKVWSAPRWSRLTNPGFTSKSLCSLYSSLRNTPFLRPSGNQGMVLDRERMITGQQENSKLRFPSSILLSDLITFSRKRTPLWMSKFHTAHTYSWMLLNRAKTWVSWTVCLRKDQTQNRSNHLEWLQRASLKIARLLAELQLLQWFCYLRHTSKGIKLPDKTDNFCTVWLSLVLSL